MDSHIKISFTEFSDTEVLLGLLSLLPFEGFEEDENGLSAFIKQQDWTHDIQQQIDEWCDSLGGRIESTHVPFENWNRVWESSYPEVCIDHLCRIYAPFHEVSSKSFDTEIQIIPQMAFGTGHHATTEMMIRLMARHRAWIAGKKCLDFGAGSGVLAIYADKNQAQKITAVEIDSYAALNMEENFQINDCPEIIGFCGDVSALPIGQQYDLILANVTRNVIHEHFEFFKNALLPQGKLMISGILAVEKDLILELAKPFHWVATEILVKDKWCAIELRQADTK